MNRPRESLLTLFDPLFSGDPVTPPSCRDSPSPDLGSDKENAAPIDDSPITLTKFFNRIYTRSKSQLPQPLPKGRLIDLGDTSASYDDSDDDGQSEHVFVVKDGSPSTSTTSREDAGDSPQRRPLADIALGDGRSSPVAMKKASPAVRCSASPFGSPSPSPFRLARPTPAPSASPLASVINAINGTTSPSSPSPSPPSTPSAPRIAVTPAEPSTPSPIRRQLRPSIMLDASPEPDTRRTSVDLQECLSVHFDESSFDLLKDRISFPENDSLGDLDMDMAPAMKEIEKEIQGEIAVMSSADAESAREPNLLDMLEERLSDMTFEDAVEDGVVPSKDGKGSTPLALSSSCDVPTPQPPVRQFIRPRNKNQVSAAPATITSKGPQAVLPRRNARASISALPVPTLTAPLRIAKKTKPDVAPAPTTAPIPARKTDAPMPLPRGTTHGMRRPSVPAKVAPSTISAFSASVRAQSQRNKQTTVLAPSTTSSKVTAAGAASSRPSGLRPPRLRVGASGIAPPRASGGDTKRLSMTTSGRLGASGVTKIGALKGDGASTSAHMMRRA